MRPSGRSPWVMIMLCEWLLLLFQVRPPCSNLIVFFREWFGHGHSGWWS